MKILALAFLLFASTSITTDTTKPDATQPKGSVKLLPERPDRRAAAAPPRYYTCPKDETMVRVAAGRRGPDELKCPLDGTPMRTGTGSDSKIFLLQ